MAIQFLRSTKSTKSSSTQVLPEGQPLYTTDEPSLAVGDGNSAAKNLPSLTNLYHHRIYLRHGSTAIYFWGYSRDPKYTLPTSDNNGDFEEMFDSDTRQVRPGYLLAAPFIGDTGLSLRSNVSGWIYYLGTYYPLVEVTGTKLDDGGTIDLYFKYLNTTANSIASYHLVLTYDSTSTDDWASTYTDTVTLCSPSI